MKKIPVEIYHCDVLTFNSYKDLKNYCRRTGAMIPETEVSYADMDNIHLTSGGLAGVMVYPQNEDGKTDLFFAVDGEQYLKNDKFDYADFIDAISHEACHMTWFILDNVGVEVDAENHESFTYLLGYLVKKYLEAHKVFDKM